MEHAAAGTGLLALLEHGPLGSAMRGSLWLYPAVETLHILGFVLLVGGIVVVDLRLLGLGRALPADLFVRHGLRSVVTGLFIAVPAGVMLFSAEATALALNPMLRAKLVLVALGLLNAALFHLGPFHRVADWRTSRPPVAARLAGGLSIVTWLTAVVCGRLIAYV